MTVSGLSTCRYNSILTTYKKSVLRLWYITVPVWLYSVPTFIYKNIWYSIHTPGPQFISCAVSFNLSDDSIQNQSFHLVIYCVNLLSESRTFRPKKSATYGCATCGYVGEICCSNSGMTSAWPTRRNIQLVWCIRTTYRSSSLLGKIWWKIQSYGPDRWNIDCRGGGHDRCYS